MINQTPREGCCGVFRSCCLELLAVAFKAHCPHRHRREDTESPLWSPDGPVHKRRSRHIVLLETEMDERHSFHSSLWQPPKLVLSRNRVWPQTCIQIIFQMCIIYLTVHKDFLIKQMSKFPLANECCTCHGLRSQNHCMLGIRS